MCRKLTLILLVVGTLLFINAVEGYSQEPGLLVEKAVVGSQFVAIQGDAGRYREDNYMTDGYTGGLEEFVASGDFDGATLDLSVRSIFDYDYRVDLKLLKEDSYFFNFSADKTRRYYAGSNEPWQPQDYGMSNSRADISDSDIYVERVNADLEFGFFNDNMPDISFGWTRWERSGEETLARGSDVAVTNSTPRQPNLRSVPAMSRVDGYSDTIFVKLSEQFGDKHNVSLKQQYEQYRDDQDITFPRYRSMPQWNQDRHFVDFPQFTELLTHLAYDSFWSEKIFVVSNYLYQNLVNESTRTVYRDNLTGNARAQYVDPSVNNRRNAHTINLGVVILDGLIDGLRWGVNSRFETARVESESYGVKSPAGRRQQSTLTEQQYGESISLSYTGIKKTNISAVVELEQRRLSWDECDDIGSHELNTNFGLGTAIDRNSDIDYSDVIAKFNVSHRINSKNKVAAMYKRSWKSRDYTNIIDNLPNVYPGYMGDSDQDIDQASISYFTVISDRITGGMEYYFERNDLQYEMQGMAGQELTRNRFSTNLTGTVTEKLTMTLLGMWEKYFLKSPAVADSANPTFTHNPSDFDYEANRFLISTNANYRINDKVSTNLRYQHTEEYGTVQSGLDEVGGGIAYDWCENGSIGLRVDLFRFDEKSSANYTVGGSGYKGFDDYSGIAVNLSCGWTF